MSPPSAERTRRQPDALVAELREVRDVLFLELGPLRRFLRGPGLSLEQHHEVVGRELLLLRRAAGAARNASVRIAIARVIIVLLPFQSGSETEF